MTMTGKERAAAWRRKHKKEGKKYVTVMLDKTASDALQELLKAKSGESISTIISLALTLYGETEGVI